MQQKLYPCDDFTDLEVLREFLDGPLARDDGSTSQAHKEVNL
jgi:hypothetical protein